MSKVVNFGCRLNNFEGKKIEELLANNNKNNGGKYWKPSLCSISKEFKAN